MNDLAIHNGKVISLNTFAADYRNRSFKYGDGLFESLRMNNGEVPLIAYHYQRLIESLKILKFQIPDYFTQEFLSKQINRLRLLKTGIKSARVRITVYRNGGGLYTPTDNSFSFLIELQELAIKGFPLNVTGLRAKIFNTHLKPCTDLGNLKTNNALLYILAGVFKAENKLDEAIILNQYQNVAECISANLFVVDEQKQIITPPLSEGCLNGVMRSYLLNNFAEIKQQPLTVHDLLNAREVFLTNSIVGIYWFKQIEDKTFSNQIVEELSSRVNKQIF